MANSITKFKVYTTLLDEVYKNAAKTSVLDGAAELARQGANADELIIPKISMDGLADYSRSSGYTSGDVTFTNETVKCNFDRGRMFTVDNVDNMDTAGMAYGKLSSEFIRTKVTPELDAFRFATYCGVSNITSTTAALSAGADVVSAISTMYDGMTDSEVPEENRYLFITSTLLGLIRDLDTTKSKEILNKFAAVITVPQARFYTAIKQNDGTTSGETAGGYSKAVDEYTASTDTSVVNGKTYYTKSGTTYTAVESPTGNPSTSNYYEKTASAGKNINFMIIHKEAVIQFQKHVAPKVVTPELNQDADAYKFGYRNVGIADAYENKAAGIGVHYSTS